MGAGSWADEGYGAQTAEAARHAASNDFEMLPAMPSLLWFRIMFQNYVSEPVFRKTNVILSQASYNRLRSGGLKRLT
jgi:hypothetical protein